MEFLHHSLRIRETVRTELEVAVVFLPVVVDHEDSGREAVVHNAVCILQDVCLILVVDELYPCVVLRHIEEQVRRNRAGCGEMCLGRCQKRLTEIGTCLYAFNCASGCIQ